jgi:hypothetical protein
MARCQAMPAAPPPAAAPAPAPPAIAPPDAAPRDDGGPSWTGDWVGHAFVGAGALALAAGAGFTLASVADERDARSSEFYDDHDQLTGRATTRRIIGVSALGAGAALVTFGVFHYLSYAADGPAPALGAWLDRGGAGAVWTVPF